MSAAASISGTSARDGPDRTSRALGTLLRTPRRTTSVALNLHKTSPRPLQRSSRPRTGRRVQRSQSSARCRPAATPSMRTRDQPSPWGRTMSFGPISSGSGHRTGQGADPSSGHSRPCWRCLPLSTLTRATCGMSRASGGGWRYRRASATSSLPATSSATLGSSTSRFLTRPTPRLGGRSTTTPTPMPGWAAPRSARRRTSSRSRSGCPGTPTPRRCVAPARATGSTSRSTSGLT